MNGYFSNIACINLSVQLGAEEIKNGARKIPAPF
jgi:hypothetical protein